MIKHVKNCISETIITPLIQTKVFTHYFYFICAGNTNFTFFELRYVDSLIESIAKVMINPGLIGIECIDDTQHMTNMSTTKASLKI